MLNYRSLEHGRPEYQQYLVVNWCFHSICNFKCTYCPENLHDGKMRGLPLDVVTRFCKNIIDTSGNRKVFFEFTGGEVTYYKHFSELLKFVKDNGADAGLISNGSRDMKFWSAHRPLIDHICLSFHAQEGDAAHFYDVVRYLNETVTTHVNIMMLPDKFDELYSLAKKIASTIEGVSVAMQPLVEGMRGDLFNYTPEQKQILDEQKLPWRENVTYTVNPDKQIKVYRGEMKQVQNDGSVSIVSTPELVSKKLNNWIGWDCYIGVENIVVDLYGNVLRGWCGVGGVIGNVADEKFVVPTKPIKCVVKNCDCGLDIMATKVNKVS